MSQILPTDAEAWFKTEAWKNGLDLSADPTTNADEFYRQYHGNKSGWDQAFAFLKDQDLASLQVGKYPIDGNNVFAFVSEMSNLEFDQTTWESHRKYNDIQYVISGKENIGITNPGAATESGEYDEANDIIFHKAEGNVFPFRPGVFFIFFPQDLHRPCIRVVGFDPVKKLVIKVRTVESTP